MELAQNFVTLSYDELSASDGGVNWDSIASGVWVAGELANICPLPQAKAITLVCWTFSAVYFIANGVDS